MLAEHTGLAHVTTSLAEGVVMLMLAPIGFDVVDRGILDRDRPGRLGVRQAWWVSLAVLPVVFIALRHVHLLEPLRAADLYATRAQEAFVGMLLLHLYFAARGPRRPRAQVTASPAGRDRERVAARCAAAEPCRTNGNPAFAGRSRREETIRIPTPARVIAADVSGWAS